MTSIAILAILVAPSTTSCGSGAGSNALLNAAVGVGAAAAGRSRGACYSACLPGTVCNRETGYCESIPCNGRCGVNETCAPSPTGGERCVPDDQRDLPPERAPDPAGPGGPAHEPDPPPTP